MTSAQAAIAGLMATGRTIAVAESLTGGGLAAALVDVPGASAVVRGGVLAYQTELKARLLQVDPQLLAQEGAVDERVAVAMAWGVRQLMGADVGLATTGEAGPQAQSSRPVGTVFIALADTAGVRTRNWQLAGSRTQIRTASVQLALALLSGSAGHASGDDQAAPGLAPREQTLPSRR
ncbi:MAG: CinA family protein [Beutenbergiaceae bacterium]